MLSILFSISGNVPQAGEGARLMSLLFLVSGRVQGVNFRGTAKFIAEKYGVFGYAQNEDDGTVTVLAQGEKEGVERFFAEVSSLNRPNFARVQKTSVIEKKEIKKADAAHFEIR